MLGDKIRCNMNEIKGNVLESELWAEDRAFIGYNTKKIIKKYKNIIQNGWQAERKGV